MRSAGLTAVLVCFVVSAPSISSAQAKRPMEINDLIGTVRVSDPQLSPDSRRILFVRTTTDLDSGKRNSDIWLVPADGSAAPARFISGDKAENSPRFSPDGRHTLF